MHALQIGQDVARQVLGQQRREAREGVQLRGHYEQQGSQQHIHTLHVAHASSVTAIAVAIAVARTFVCVARDVRVCGCGEHACRSSEHPGELALGDHSPEDLQRERERERGRCEK